MHTHVVRHWFGSVPASYRRFKAVSKPRLLATIVVQWVPFGVKKSVVDQIAAIATRELPYSTHTDVAGHKKNESRAATPGVFTLLPLHTGHPLSGTRVAHHRSPYGVGTVLARHWIYGTLRTRHPGGAHP